MVVQTIQLGDSFFPYRDLVNFHPPEHLGRPFRFSEPVFPIAQGYAVPPVVCEPVYRLQVVPQRQSRGHPGVLVYYKKRALDPRIPQRGSGSLRGVGARPTNQSELSAPSKTENTEGMKG